jgi:predicted nucleotidyltransferase
MLSSQEILKLIKSKILEVIPDAAVFIFGSRTTNTATEESDWDILIITKNRTDKKIKRIAQEALFPLSIHLASFINTIIVSEDDWNSNPSYYSLRKSISAKSQLA